MFRQTKLESLLELLCANKVTQQRLIEALDEQITATDGICKEAAIKSLFDESAKAKAFGSLYLCKYLEDLRDFVKKQ